MRMKLEGGQVVPEMIEVDGEIVEECVVAILNIPLTDKLRAELRFHSGDAQSMRFYKNVGVYKGEELEGDVTAELVGEFVPSCHTIQDFVAILTKAQEKEGF